MFEIKCSVCNKFGATATDQKLGKRWLCCNSTKKTGYKVPCNKYTSVNWNNDDEAKLYQLSFLIHTTSAKTEEWDLNEYKIKYNSHIQNKNDHV